MASGFVEKIFKKIVELDASDAYITSGKPPVYRVNKNFVYHDDQDLNKDDISFLVNRLLDEKQNEEFHKKLEYNISLEWKDQSRFRINFFYQQLSQGMVIRRVKTDIPTIESLNLPKIYSDLICESKGLIIVSSPSGTGKSTSVAAMLDYRNKNYFGHIITIEDPIEFIHLNNKCIFTQREIGVDTLSYSAALKNALRQRADIVFIGEIRDAETMEHAINFAETGHLCVATLHSNNATQAISRMINFFPEESHKKVLTNLSNYLKGIISQRLVNNKSGSKSMAVEVLLNLGIIKNLIADNRIDEIRDHIEKNQDLGMSSFDSYLYDMFVKNIITEEEATENSDNSSGFKLRILQSKSIKNSKTSLDDKAQSNKNSIF